MASAKRVGDINDTRDVQLTLTIEEANFLGNLLGNIGFPSRNLVCIYNALGQSGVEWSGMNPFQQRDVSLKEEHK